jgi:pimeloyl-ACP methyl ester carboxylesterase
VPVTFREEYYKSGDGLRLYARLYGNAKGAQPGVLCLHGLTRNSRDFEDLAPHLATRFQVIAPDLRGRGLSDRDPQPANYQPKMYLADVVALLDALAVTRTIVIGTSLGGLIAMMMAATMAGRIAGIVLNDVGPEIDPTGMQRIKSYAGTLPPVRNWSEAVLQAQTVYGTAWPDLAAARWQAIVRRGYRENASGVPQVDADPMIGASLRAAPDNAFDMWPLWRALAGVPILALRGAHSDILSAATLERMHHEKPDLESVTVPNRGHVPLLDEPASLTAIDGFLSRFEPREA